jgi:Uma2 family endonuclease
MATSTSDRPMTAEDLMALPDDGTRYELSRGVLICMSPAAYWSGKIGGRIARKMGNFAEEHGLGECGVPDTGFRLSRNPDTVREPDVWFIRSDRLPTREAESEYFDGPPDIAGEVISPTDRFEDVMRKVRDYLDAGTRLVWAFDPGPRTTLVFRPDGSFAFVDEDGILDGEDVLPGFTLPLKEIWT